MPGVIFSNTLRANFRGMLAWGVGLGLMGMMLAAIIPNVEALQQYAEIVDQLPPFLLSAIGTSAAAIATPEGYIGFGFFTYATFILCAYGVMTGLSITAGEEDSGILDIVLSQPITRWRIVVERFAAHAILTAGIVLISYLGIVIGSLFTGLEFDLGKVALSSIALYPVILFVIAMTAVLGVIFRRKNMAMSAAAVIIIGSYFLNFLGESATDTILEDLRAASFFRYFETNQVMAEGLNFAHMGLLIAVAAVCAAGTVMLFERRDVGV